MAFVMNVYPQVDIPQSESIDYLESDTTIIELNFEENLDSLLQQYYFRQSGAAELKYSVRDTAFTIPDYPDSVYIERIAAIPTVVGLAYNNYVRNYINVYAKQRRSSVEIMLGLGNYYFPIFDEIFDYYDVPNELKYMSIIESALNPAAHSRAGAVGLWQFMYNTGKMYGLTMNSLVDERRDPVASTHAAARYIKDLYEMYNDWILAVAAYNCGPGNVNKAIRRAGGKKDYWDIYPFLPRETRGHVPAFIAATYIMNYYPEHNLLPADIAYPLTNDTIMITRQLHLEQVSEVLDIPMQLLRDINPQYRADLIPVTKNPLPLRLPMEKAFRFIDLEDSVYSYKDSVYFNPERLNKTAAALSSLPGAPPPANSTQIVYTVKAGDNIGYIAEWYNVGASNIRNWNNISGNLIRTGQKLNIYVPNNLASQYQDIDNLSFEQKQARIGKAVSVPVARASSVVTTGNDGDYIIYTVRSGDTLWDIARQYPGVTETDIMRLNNLSNARRIQVGQTLRIPPTR